jgi:hypothetical protein
MVKPAARKGAGWRDEYVLFECRVMKLIGPVRGSRGIPDYIHADVELPEKYRENAMKSGWNDDGTYRVEVNVNHNRKTLAPFIASGDLEWDVRGMP